MEFNSSEKNILSKDVIFEGRRGLLFGLETFICKKKELRFVFVFIPYNPRERFPSLDFSSFQKKKTGFFSEKKITRVYVVRIVRLEFFEI